MNLQIARAMLSNMPDDVFNIYIAPLIQSHNWPFASYNQRPTAETLRWQQMFDHQSIQTISQLSWKRHEFPFSLGLFCPNAQQLITAIIEHNSGVGFYPALANIANSKEKFFRAREFIARTSQMPVPVILQHSPFGFRILDGNHRLAAMASFANAKAGTIDCWIGS